MSDGKYSELGRYILALCEAHNLSLRQASMKAGLEAGTISKILQRDGISTPNPETLEKIAQAEARIAEIGPERKRLARAYAKGKMELEIYHETDGELRDAQDAAGARLAELRTMLAVRPDPAVVSRYVEELLAQGFDLSQVPPDTLRSALHKAGVKAFVEEGEVLFCAFST